ncbi:MAG: heme-binding domain-containing protein [Candidatus Kapabacteria bacterium]|nr:heme-binding domain-containing protein [Ignavibacteriota bacterium]MCW5883627.1 heme-binding domain-containing protein [Candidatus Kapabacteria bacterium]
MKINKLAIITISVVLILIILQLIIVKHDNPEIKTVPDWDSDYTKETFYAICADCHSNETRWQWYSHIPPFSLIIHRDVNEGRKHFNISEYVREDGIKSAYEFNKGEMPLWIYTIIHSHPALSEPEKTKFFSGLEATFGKYEKSKIDKNIYNHPED